MVYNDNSMDAANDQATSHYKIKVNEVNTTKYEQANYFHRRHKYRI